MVCGPSFFHVDKHVDRSAKDPCTRLVPFSIFRSGFREQKPINHVQASFVDPRRGFMLALWTKVVSWMQEEKGASMVEYALLVVLIAIVALVAVRLAGREVSSTFSEIGSGLS